MNTLKQTIRKLWQHQFGKLALIGLTGITLWGLYTAVTTIRAYTDPRSQTFVQWAAGSTSERQPLVTTQRETCPNAPFLLPSDGFIGLLYEDPRGPYSPSHPHQGIDIFSEGDPGVTPVYAAYDGYLTREADWRSAVIIRVPDDPLQPGRQIWLYYAHMADKDGNSFIVDAFPPDTHELFVSQGTLIGYTGNYNGASARQIWTHLHFSIVRDDGNGRYANELVFSNTLDPSPYLGMALNYHCADIPPTCTAPTSRQPAPPSPSAPLRTAVSVLKSLLMTQEENNKPTSRWPRRLWLMSPSLVVLAGILLFNWYFYFRQPAPIATAVYQPTPPATINTKTAVTSQPATPATQPIQPPTPAPTATPSLPTEAPPTLLGPPDNAIFTAQDSATFYWQYPDLLPDNYQFTVYIQQGGTTFATSSLNEPNLGLSYRAAMPLTFDVTEMTALEWWVQIETNEGTAVSRSETRTIRLIPAQN